MSAITDFNYDSDEELYFAYWLKELEQVGMVKEWTREVASFRLTEGLEHPYTKVTHLKTKVKTESKVQMLLEPSIYTPDFSVKWTEKAYGRICQPLYDHSKITAPFLVDCDNISIVEVKPSFDQNNMERLFKNNQKIVWDKWKVYVNLTHLEKLFNKTFTPQARLFKKNGDLRKITKWEVKTIDQYLKSILL